jgi:hypothetical protein
MAQFAAPQKVPETDVTKEQLALLRSLHASGTKAAVSTQELADKVVRVWDILEIARGERPARSGPERTVWDSVASLYGGPKKDMATAVNALEKIHVGLIGDLRTACSKAEDLGTSIDAIRGMADIILKAIPQGGYQSYKPRFRELVELSFVELGKVVPWKRET